MWHRTRVLGCGHFLFVRFDHDVNSDRQAELADGLGCVDDDGANGGLLVVLL